MGEEGYETIEDYVCRRFTRVDNTVCVNFGSGTQHVELIPGQFPQNIRVPVSETPSNYVGQIWPLHVPYFIADISRPRKMVDAVSVSTVPAMATK
jgi:hypothetical protein